MPNMASTPSPRTPASFSDGESQHTLRSKRSSIMIKCSDGSEVIFLRPHLPRSGSYATVSTSQSPSPPPGPNSGPGPSPGDSDGSDPDDKKKGKRPVSMPTYSNVYDSDNHSGQSHRSLPTYLEGRCSECGYLRSHPDICSIRNRLFLRALTSRPPALVPMQADEGIHNDSIRYPRTRHGHGSPRRNGIVQPHLADVDHSRSTSGTTSRSSSSRPSETARRGTHRPGRSTDSRPRHSRSQTNHTPSSHQEARYSIEAVVGRGPSSRHDKIRLELRELSPHRHTQENTFPLHYFDANIRGGYGSGAYGSSGNRDSGGGTGRRSRSRDVLLRGLRRAVLWLFGADSESGSSRRREAYDYYARHENRAQARSRSRQTRRR
ncbi:hypothetical protein F4679DRAFT_562165 [Xylaria curta]|nr:hypothetical protein F4679DRAFT_562165 [Xylaria curta]